MLPTSFWKTNIVHKIKSSGLNTCRHQLYNLKLGKLHMTTIGYETKTLGQSKFHVSTDFIEMAVVANDVGNRNTTKLGF